MKLFKDTIKVLFKRRNIAENTEMLKPIVLAQHTSPIFLLISSHCVAQAWPIVVILSRKHIFKCSNGKRQKLPTPDSKQNKIDTKRYTPIDGMVD